MCKGVAAAAWIKVVTLERRKHFLRAGGEKEKEWVLSFIFTNEGFIKALWLTNISAVVSGIQCSNKRSHY